MKLRTLLITAISSIALLSGCDGALDKKPKTKILFTPGTVTCFELNAAKTWMYSKQIGIMPPQNIRHLCSRETTTQEIQDHIVAYREDGKIAEIKVGTKYFWVLKDELQYIND
jgi:hypothetical protein